MKIKVCLHYNGKNKKVYMEKHKKNVLIFTKFTDVFVCETNLNITYTRCFTYNQNYNHINTSLAQIMKYIFSFFHLEKRFLKKKKRNWSHVIHEFV